MTYSHMGSPTLPSALSRFTTEFEMGSGGTNSLLSSGKLAAQGAIRLPRSMLSSDGYCTDLGL